MVNHRISRHTASRARASRSRVALVAATLAATFLATALLPVGDAFAQGRKKTAHAKVTAPENRVSLNFVGADIESVIRAMGQFLKRDFVIDPRVKGTINLSTEHPVTRAEAYRLLLTALRFQGFTIVDSAGVYKVLPEADAKFAGGPTQIGRVAPRSDGIRGDQIVTQIFRLNYESASNMVNMLRPLVTANNPITVNPGNNSIVITDYADNLQRIGRIIAGVDTPPSADGDVVPLQYALAVDVAPLVQRLMEPAQGGAIDPGQRVTVLADPRTNTVVLRASSPARIASAKGLIARLDVPTTTAGNIHIVNLKNAEAVKLAQILRSVIAGDSSALSPSSSSSSFAGSAAGTSNPLGMQQGSLGTTPPGIPPSAASGSYGSPSSFGSIASTISNPFSSAAAGGGSPSGGAIQADPATNSLIITAPEPVYRNLRTVIASLDVRRPQVFIEALIVEVTAERAAEFGIQWQDFSGINKSGTNVIGGTNFGGVGTNIISSSVSPGSVGQGLNVGIVKGTINIPGLGTITNLGALARALETDNNANILSTPNLLTLDNEEAQIIVGQQVPFVTGQYAQTGTSNSVTPFQTIERRDVGLTLKIKPTIADNGTVKLLIYQEVSSIVNSTISSPAGPTTNKRAISTVVQPEDGQFVVLGGLIQDTAQNGVSQVPLLGDIPYIGGLFRYQNRSHSKTNLLVILRPYIVREPTANGIFADKYDMMRKVQIDSQPEHSVVLPDYTGTVIPPRDEAPKPGTYEPFRSPMTRPVPQSDAPTKLPVEPMQQPTTESTTQPVAPPPGTTQ